DGQVRFSVEDTGPGVDEAARAKIFEAFAQADHGAQFGGAGLGLAIARSLAHAMDGEVGVDNARGGGAVFWFEAPFARTPAVADRSLAGRRIGVASPNRVVREAARRQIEACGGEAVLAGDKATLVKLTQPGDVVLVDHAFVAGRRALRRPQGRTTIVLLDLQEREHIAIYRDAGFAGYLLKPLRRTSLSERVLAAVRAEPQSE